MHSWCHDTYGKLGEEPGSKRIVGFPPVSEIVEWSKIVLTVTSRTM